MSEPTSAPPGSSGQFSLDLELAAEAVRDLENVRQQLVTMRLDAAELGRLTLAEPSATDSVSAEAFTLLAQKAAGGPGSLAFALDAGIVHVEGLIMQMNADIAAQQDEEERAVRALRVT